MPMITKQKLNNASYVTISTTPFQRGVANRLTVLWQRLNPILPPGAMSVNYRSYWGGFFNP